MKRRDIVRVGALTPFCLGLDSLIDSRKCSGSISPKAKSCILLWLDGGPSHLETFDPKPNVPVEVRGPFRSIATNVPGIELSELLPETAKVANHLAIVRSMTSPLGEHGIANRYLLTGYKPSTISYPTFGSVVQHVRGDSNVLPNHVAIPELRSAGAGFLGSQAEPFATRGNPSEANFQVRDLELYPTVDEARLMRRRRILSDLDKTQQAFEQSGSNETTSMDRAFRLVLSPTAKQAFDLKREPESMRQSYGPRMFGQSCLLARRLVERGVNFVTVQYTGWDTHDNLKLQLRDGFAGAKVGVGLVPTFDQAFSTLIRDLDNIGLLSETLVVAMGEFGRTPKLNARGGRDHWPRVFSVVMAGGGVRGGQVIGSSDRIGESPKDTPVKPEDLAFSMYQMLGIDPSTVLKSSDGRPIPVVQGGVAIPGLV